MRTRFWFHSAMLLAASAIATASVPAAEAQQFSPWSAPVELNNLTDSSGPCPAVNSTSPDTNDTHPALSKDRLSLYFASTRGTDPVTGNYRLWFTTRSSLDSCWGAPMYLGDVVNDTRLVNGVQAINFAPNLTPDGHWLYFHSNRPGGCGGADLYVSYRAHESDNLGWESPINLGCTINTNTPPVNPPNPSCVINPNTPTLGQAGPTYFEDVATGTHYLYFTQMPTGTSDACFDIYVSSCPATADLAACNTQGLWGKGTPVDKLNSPVRDTRTAIRRDGLEMILSTGRSGSLLSENLWVSTRPVVTEDQLNWEIPQPINCEWQANVTAIIGSMSPPSPCPPWNPIDPPGTPPATTLFVNSAAFDGGPALSWDGTELYFFRVVNANNMLRTCTVLPTSPDTDTSPFCRDLYRSTRTILIGFPTTTTLSSSTNPSPFGQSVTFTVTVSSKSGDTPTGTVTFSDGPTSLGTVALTSGEASFTTSSLSIGSHSITAQYNPGRSFGDSTGSLTQNVEYGICVLYDQTRSVNSGATFPIRLQLCDVNGNDLSSSVIVVRATAVTAISGFSGTPDSPGDANPDNNFRFDATLGTAGGYIFNLSTGGLASGTYRLQFTAGSDPLTHSVNFGVK